MSCCVLNAAPSHAQQQQHCTDGNWALACSLPSPTLCLHKCGPPCCIALDRGRGRGPAEGVAGSCVGRMSAAQMSLNDV